ncbi:MAG TPA: hypothetical protein VFO93_21170 [Hymenobacter sp.]|uniref:hypothetical protein n=1 Tax=Hymenobacter sp. TaxID=1898978 RepID=UPI002D7FA6A9|nr:hypothetical protein [Hymenobacter sp.]HET9506066.1 hypothetical protein [Hymenobacter sp.]
MYKIQPTGCAWVLLGQSLVLLLPILKLLQVPGIADWPWLGVLTPVWGPGILLALILGVEHLISSIKKVHVRYPKQAIAQELHNA